MKKNNNALSLYILVKRNIKLYLKDRMTVFFSVLAPIIVLLLYILFLGKIQTDTIMNMVIDGYRVSDYLTKTDINALINNWMIAGVMGVSCITVALNANIVMVRDRMTGNVNDVIASPVKRWVLYLSYIISCFLITFGICFIVLMISVIYLACSGGLMMTFSEFLGILGITILSILSSAFFTVLICGFIKTTSALAAMNGVFSTAIGFLIGSYLPFSMLPTYIQYMACFIPGTYSAGLFRNYFMGGVIRLFKSKVPDMEIIKGIFDSYSIDLKFFGTTVSSSWMVLALLISIVVFGSLILIFYSNKKTNFFALGRKKLKKIKNNKR